MMRNVSVLNKKHKCKHLIKICPSCGREIESPKTKTSDLESEICDLRDKVNQLIDCVKELMEKI